MQSPHTLEPRPEDREVFERLLRAFVPPRPFDAHAHLYFAEMDGEPVGASAYDRLMSSWMGERAPVAGMFFAFPRRELDVERVNAFVTGEVRSARDSRALLLVRPGDRPDAVERQVVTSRDAIAGFKVYHVFADRPDTMEARVGEFLPEWAWELADRHGLVIMLHIVRARALADELNQSDLRDACLRHPGARLVLAHAARGFCADHTVEGIASLRGLENVWFDTSAICEPGAMMAILREFGPRRLLWGSDFPVSNFLGRATSLGDGFFWLERDNVDWKSGALGRPTLVGIESLLALRQACRLLALGDADVERIFIDNARELLGDASSGDVTSALYRRGREIIPGGTQLLSKRPELHAPERWPAYFEEARGVTVTDLDGRRRVDMSTMALGACLLGYAHPAVDAAVSRRIVLGSMSSLNPPEEVELAELLLELHPWAAMARFARSGGEALAIAVRIARARTGRERIAFCGYHGWHDWYLAANLGARGVEDRLVGHLLPGLEPLGVPGALAGTALPFRYNHLDELEALVREHGETLAAVVIEPLRSAAPAPGFLEGVRELASSCGAALVFDEVSIGWRLCTGGAHLLHGVWPDMAVFSKATGNGYPIAAVIGVADVMEAAGRSFISSTMWTEAIGPTAALATIRTMRHHDVAGHVARVGSRYRDGLRAIAERHGVSVTISGPPALTRVAFDHEDAAALQTMFTVRMLDRGFLAGAAFYPSLAHEERHVDAFLEAGEPVFEELSESVRAGDTAKRIGSPVHHESFRRLT